MAEIKAEDFIRIATLAVPAAISALAFSPDGKILAVASADKVHLYRMPEVKSDEESKASA